MTPEPLTRTQAAAKRCTDLVVASTAVLLLSPVFLTISLSIVVTSGRPVLYRQTRVGRNGKPFTMYKFRTMTVGADAMHDALAEQNDRSGPLLKINDDPRVTTIGRVLRRSSLDELPQLFNVLQGTMSLVGPRPALPSEVMHFSAQVRVRESVPQGITGLWQVEGRSEPDFETYSNLDLTYVDRQSFLTDLGIILRTPGAMIRHALKRNAIRGDAPPTSAGSSDPTPDAGESSSDDTAV